MDTGGGILAIWACCGYLGRVSINNKCLTHNSCGIHHTAGKAKRDQETRCFLDQDKCTSVV